VVNRWTSAEKALARFSCLRSEARSHAFEWKAVQIGVKMTGQRCLSVAEPSEALGVRSCDDSRRMLRAPDASSRQVIWRQPTVVLDAKQLF